MSHILAYQWYPSQDLLEYQRGHHRNIIPYPMCTYSADEARSPLSQTSVATESAETGWDGAGGLHFDSESTSVPMGSESAGDQHDCAPMSSPTGHSGHVLSTAPTSSASSPPTSVKIEPDDPDSRFIMDLAAYPPQSTTSSRSSPESCGFNEPLQPSVPPAEVPLRATQASKEMRRMMGVFRLNPFSMHNLSRSGDGEDSALGSPTGSATWCGEAGPLEEEPVVLEFQLDIIHLDEGGLHALCSNTKSSIPVISADEESQLRAFSPSFELQGGDISERKENQSPDPDQEFAVQNGNVAETEKDLDDNDRYGSSWEDGVRTESDGNTSTSSTVSVQTPLDGGSCSPFHDVQDGLSVGGCEQDQTHVHSHTTSLTVDIPSSPVWNDMGIAEQYETSPSSISAALGGPRLNFVYPESPQRGQRLHSTNSHPYLRKNSQSYPISPTHSPNPYSRTYSHSILHQIQAQPDVFAFQPTLYHLRRLSIAQDPTTPQDHSSPIAPNNLQYPLNQQQQQHQQNHHQAQPHDQNQHPQHHRYHQYQQQQLYSGHQAQISSVGGLPVSTSVCVRRSTIPAGFADDAVTGHVTGNGQANSGSSYVTMRSPGAGQAHTYANRFEGEQEAYVSSPHSPTGHAQLSHTEGLHPAHQHHHHHQQQEHLSHHNHHHHQQEMSSPSSPLGHGRGHRHGVAAVTVGNATHATMSVQGGHVVTRSPVTGNQYPRRWSLPEATVQHIGHTGAFLGH